MTVRIGAVIMLRDMAPFIGEVVKCLSWVDGIFVYDDHSRDGGNDLARVSAEVPIVISTSNDPRSAFERGEMEARNQAIDWAFSALEVDLMFCVDADELVDCAIRPVLEKMWYDGYHDSLCLSMWHLYDSENYIRFYETTINGVDLVDPHTRVIGRHRRFEPLFADGSHPIIPATERTLCVHGPHHFHLKYFAESPYPNHALKFLPKRLTREAVAPFLAPLPFKLPPSVGLAIGRIEWRKLKQLETSYYDAYSSDRVHLASPEMALRHPRDYDGSESW